MEMISVSWYLSGEQVVRCVKIAEEAVRFSCRMVLEVAQLQKRPSGSMAFCHHPSSSVM
jgi:hypothetical protein